MALRKPTKPKSIDPSNLQTDLRKHLLLGTPRL